MLEREFMNNYPNDPTTQYGQYPPQQPVGPPKKKPNGWLVAGIVIGFFVLLAAYGSTLNKDSSTTSQPTTSHEDIGGNPVPTPTPTPIPKAWKTTHTYTGNGDNQTETIKVVDDWKIQWFCQYDGAALIVQVYDANTSDMADFDAVNTTCKSTPTRGESFEHKGGSVYLKIFSGIDWTITIQELK